MELFKEIPCGAGHQVSFCRSFYQSAEEQKPLSTLLTSYDIRVNVGSFGDTGDSGITMGHDSRDRDF
jgi:hypothetical protein